MLKDAREHPVLVLTCCVVATVALLVSEAPYLAVLPASPLVAFFTSYRRRPSGK